MQYTTYTKKIRICLLPYLFDFFSFKFFPFPFKNTSRFLKCVILPYATCDNVKDDLGMHLKPRQFVELSLVIDGIELSAGSGTRE